MLRASRSKVSEKWMYQKIWVFIIAAALGITGMTMHVDWLVTIAIAILAVAILASLISDRRSRDAQEEQTDHSEE